MPATQPATDEEIDTAILRLLAPTGDDLVRWKVIEPRVPGGFWQKAEACQWLYDAGKRGAVTAGMTRWPFRAQPDALGECCRSNPPEYPSGADRHGRHDHARQQFPGHVNRRYCRSRD